MIDSQVSARKHTSQQKKHSVSEKTRSDNPSPNSPQQYSPVLMVRPIKNLGRKYLQEHLFKVQPKQHHEVVISDEVVRNSKLYRMLREKVQIREAMFVKQCNQLRETKEKLAQDITQITHKNQNTKLNLWQLKNQILQLKAMLVDQEQEARRLDFQMQNPQQPIYAEQNQQAQLEMPNQQEADNVRLSSEQFEQNEQNNKEDWLQIESSQLKQEQKDIKVIMSHLHKKIGLNPQHQKQNSQSQKRTHNYKLKQFKEEQIE